MKIFRSWALALALLAMPGLVAAQVTQPVPTAIGIGGAPKDVTAAAIMIAPAGGAAGKGTPLSYDKGIPIQGRDTGTGLPCTIGVASTCQLPGSGGGGGGGAVTIAGGADVVEGASADTASTNTIFGNLQAIKAAAQDTTTESPVKVADGSDVTLGLTTAAACATDNGNCAIAALIKRTNQRLTSFAAQFPAALGSTTKAASLSITFASDQTLPAFTATPAFKVDQTTPGTTNLVQTANWPSTIDTNAGAAGASTPRVVLATGGASLKLLDTAGTNVATIKAASTAPATTDTSLVVAQSPLPAPVCTSSIAINQTASTDLVTSVAKLHICSIILISATSQNLSLVEGTGSVCATSIAALIGGTTASLAVPANGGFSAVGDRVFLKSKTTADHVCLLQSGAGNVSGVITYADAS